jgi:nitroreductase
VKIYVREWFVNAPIVVACCVDYSKAWLRSDAKNYGDVDAAIAVDHLTLAAAENGLATCWVANFDVSVAESEFDFGENYKPLAFIALGYPADSSQKKVRKEIKDFVEFK